MMSSNTRCVFIWWIVFVFSCGQGQGQDAAKAPSSVCYYENPTCDPSSWEPEICRTGQMQSPIDLPYNSAMYTRIAELSQSSSCTAEQAFNMINNGNSVQATLQSDLSSTCTMEGSLLNGQYIFSQAHFHWGSSDEKGSEHTINNKRYAIEAHFVHYSSEYQSFAEARDSIKAGALAVVAVLHTVGGNDNPYLAPVVNAIQNIKQYNTTAAGSKLVLSSLFPKSPSMDFDVVQYSGSLTTPTCNENVLWNVFANPVSISANQMSVFRTMKNLVGKPLVNNFRPTQKQNKRDIAVVRFHQSRSTGQSQLGFKYQCMKTYILSLIFINAILLYVR